MDTGMCHQSLYFVKRVSAPMDDLFYLERPLTDQESKTFSNGRREQGHTQVNW